MASSTTFFNEDTIHGKVKRFMYMRHLQAFVPITQHSGLRAIIYDAFAGSGIYGKNWPDTIEELGSPLIALRVVIEDFIKRKELDCSFNKSRNVNFDIAKYERFVKRIRKKVKTRGRKRVTMPDLQTDVILNFSEADEDSYLQLFINVIQVLKFYGIAYKRSYDRCGVITVKSLNRTFSFGCNIALSEFKHTLLPECGNKSRYMTFIDPFGFSKIPMSHIQNFVGQNKEVLITFMSGFVDRFKTLKKNKKVVMELFGFRDDDDDNDDDYDDDDNDDDDDDDDDGGVDDDNDDNDVDDDGIDQYHELLQVSRERDGITRCMETYEKQLMKRAHSDMVLTFEIRNISNRRIYHLIFITNHRKGLETMKEAMNRGTQSPESFSLSEYLILRKGIPLALGNIQSNELVAQKIFNEFQGKENVRISDIKDFILFDTPFIFRKGALKILQTEKNPRLTKVVDIYNKPPRRRWTFPDHSGDWFLTFRMPDALEGTPAWNFTQ